MGGGLWKLNVGGNMVRIWWFLMWWDDGEVMMVFRCSQERLSQILRKGG